MLRIFTLTLVCAVIIQEGTTLECFQCNSVSSDGSSCGDPFSGDPSITPRCNSIPGVEGVCVKQQVLSTAGDISITTRTCQTKNTKYCENLESSLETIGAGTLQHCSYCDDELCNAGPTSAAVSISALLLAVAAAFRHFIFQ